jgi:hypothetical protein
VCPLPTSQWGEGRRVAVPNCGLVWVTLPASLSQPLAVTVLLSARSSFVLGGVFKMHVPSVWWRTFPLSGGLAFLVDQEGLFSCPMPRLALFLAQRRPSGSEYTANFILFKYSMIPSWWLSSLPWTSRPATSFGIAARSRLIAFDFTWLLLMAFFIYLFGMVVLHRFCSSRMCSSLLSGTRSSIIGRHPEVSSQGLMTAALPKRQ